MLLFKTIVGALIALCLAGVSLADIPARPFSREDARDAAAEAERERLAAVRVAQRPAYMVRYPVTVETGPAPLRPVAREPFLPRTRWEHRQGSALWTRAALSAIEGHSSLAQIVPRDIDRWCPAYSENGPELRQAFWVGMMSALAKHESTYRPGAVGGGDLWYGLLQIYPDTARRYGCRARTGDALKNPTENLSCAARIMAVTVDRDQAVALHDGRWRGVAADWGPMTNRNKIADMAGWTSSQSYCTVPQVARPRERPETLLARQILPPRPQARPMLEAWVSTMDARSH